MTTSEERLSGANGESSVSAGCETLTLDFSYIGGALAAIMTALLPVTYWTHGSASKLESATFALVTNRQQQVVDPALMTAISALPSGLPTLNKQQRDSLYLPIDAYAKLDRLSERVLTIRDRTSQAIYLGAVCSITTFVTGVLYAMENGLYGLFAVISGLLLVSYLDSGIFQVRKIRALERINRRILTSSSVEDLRDAASEALSKYLT